MTFLWPEMLRLLLLVPALIAIYALSWRRSKQAALRYAGVRMVQEAAGASRSFRRHIPALLFLAALTIAILAIARPAAVLTLPTRQVTIILAIDVSGSMRATDVEPSRIAAAQSAAKAFVAGQPSYVRVGVVSFAAMAALAQAPTFNRQDVLAAIDGFQLQTNTAIGSGIIVALAAIFPEEKTDLYLLNDEGAVLRGAPRGDKKSAKPGYQPVAPGSYSSAAIILLTDGRRTTGPSVIAAAQMAARRGVRVFTVGIGTTGEHTMDSEASPPYESLHEGMLKAIAHMTRGEYFYAGNVSDLNKIYRSLSARFVLDRKQTEITALFSAAAAFAALVSALLSILWFDRLL